jgi:predicted  nucleic acid-binding Zn-ribbon protein
MTEAQNIIAGFREVIQDLLVPEFKALKTEIHFMQKALENNSNEIKELRVEIRDLFFNKIFELSERIAKLEQKVDQ